MSGLRALTGCFGLSLCVLAFACGDADGGAGLDGETSPSGMASDTLGGGAADDSSDSSDDAASVASDDASAATASLSGQVTRTAEIQEDGIGDLYVALFETNPVRFEEGPEPVLVTRALLEDQDLNAEDSVVTYLMEGIPPRPEPYFVITFFDDNDTIDVDAPGPDKGDLVSLTGPSADEVVLDAPEVYEHDLILNAVMPL